MSLSLEHQLLNMFEIQKMNFENAIIASGYSLTFDLNEVFDKSVFKKQIGLVKKFLLLPHLVRKINEPNHLGYFNYYDKLIMDCSILGSLQLLNIFLHYGNALTDNVSYFTHLHTNLVKGGRRATNDMVVSITFYQKMLAFGHPNPNYQWINRIIEKQTEISLQVIDFNNFREELTYLKTIVLCSYPKFCCMMRKNC